MNSRWHVIFVLLLLTGATGCSRFRDLTRRDYALLRDPFVNRFSTDDDVADTAEPFDDEDTSGRVWIDDTATAAANHDFSNELRTENSLFGTSATASRLGEIQIQGSPNDVAQASGPSLSDFIGMRPEQPTTKMAPLPKRPDVKRKVAKFGVFAEKRTASIEETVTPADVNNDFADWASLQHKKWNSDGPSPADHVLPGQIRQVSQTVKTPATDDGLPTLPSPDLAGFGTDVTDKVTPLTAPSRSQNTTTSPPIGSENPFPGTTSARNSTTPSQTTIPPPKLDLAAPTASSNAHVLRQQPRPPVFDSPAKRSETTPDPFVNFNKSRTAAGGTFAEPSKAATSGSVDSTFHFDTGWKPSNLTRP